MNSQMSLEEGPDESNSEDDAVVITENDCNTQDVTVGLDSPNLHEGVSSTAPECMCFVNDVQLSDCRSSQTTCADNEQLISLSDNAKPYSHASSVADVGGTEFSSFNEEKISRTTQPNPRGTVPDSLAVVRVLSNSPKCSDEQLFLKVDVTMNETACNNCLALQELASNALNIKDDDFVEIDNCDQVPLDEDKIDDNSYADSLSSSVSMTDSDALSSQDNSLDELSESESITDVTPLHSPYCCDSPLPQGRSLDSNKTACSDQLLKVVDRESEKSAATSSDRQKIHQDSPRIHQARSPCPQNEQAGMNVLAEAVKRLEIETEQKKTVERNCFTPPSKNKRKNMSFSNDDVRKIDQENQRLLKRIVSQQGRLKARFPVQPQVSHLASSAVNRQRQQRQIEVENLALLKRIQTIKPSREVSKNLLRQHKCLSHPSSKPSSQPASQLSPSTSTPRSLHGSVSSLHFSGENTASFSKHGDFAQTNLASDDIKSVEI